MNLAPHRSPLALRLLLASGAILALFGGAAGVQTPPPSGEPQIVAGIPDVATARSIINLADLAAEQALAPEAATEPRVIHAPLPRGSAQPAPPEGAEAPSSADAPPAAEALEPVAESPAPSSSFLALEDNNTSIPPDTHGAVGPDHLMVTLNTQVRIQNRSGTALSTVTLNSFWSSLGNPTSFDPKVLYDPASGRWIMTSVSNAQSANSSVLIGVSQGTNPTGTWFLYKVDADANNVVWADYPSLGFNKNWIVVQVNMFTNANNSFVRSNIYAFNKANLYAGSTGAFTLMQDTSGGFTTCPAITYDNVLNTEFLVETWNSNFNGQGFLRLSTITGSVGAEVLTTGTFFPAISTPWGFGVSNDFAPQSGTAQKIQTNDDRVQNVVYRNGSLWAAHTAFYPASGSNHSGAQVLQLNPTNGTILQRCLIEDPAANTFVAFPSVAVNKNDDVLIGYARFSATTFASGAYAFRLGTDPLNSLQSGQILKAGEAPYFKTFSGTKNRWGDYSSTVVDPQNDVDMWTIQEYAATASGGFDRWGTWWGRVVPAGGTPSPATWVITMSKSSYVNGDTITVTEFGPKNTGTSPATVRIQVNMTIPGMGTLPVIDAGSDGTLTLPANINVNFGPLSLFTVTSGSPPKGNWSFDSKLTVPSTGAIVSQDVNPFAVQ